MVKLHQAEILQVLLRLVLHFFQGENGSTGDTSSGKGDIFRVNESTLNTSVTIASGDNASCASL